MKHICPLQLKVISGWARLFGKKDEIFYMKFKRWIEQMLYPLLNG